MDSTTQKTIQNPWEDRVSFPRLKTAHYVPALLAVMLSALQLSCFQFEQLSMILLPVLFVFVVVTVRKPGSVAVILLITLTASFLSASLTVGAIVLSLIVGTGCLAWLFTVLRPPYLPIALLVAVGALSWILSGDWGTALLALAFLPAAAGLAYATLSDRGRTSVICFGIGGLLISILALFAIAFYRINGTLELSAIEAALEAARNAAVESVMGVRAALIEQIEIAGAEAAEAENAAALIEELKTSMSRENVTLLVSMLFNLIPGLLISVCAILSFGAQLVQGMQYRFTGWTQVLTPNACIFTMSVVASILYYVGFLFMLFVDSTTMLGAVMQNVCIILLPGLCLVGFADLLTRLRASRGGGRFFRVLIFASLFCCAGLSALFFVALWGANCSILLALHRKMTAQKQNDREDDQSKGD